MRSHIQSQTWHRFLHAFSQFQRELWNVEENVYYHSARRRTVIRIPLPAHVQSSACGSWACGGRGGRGGGGTPLSAICDFLFQTLENPLVVGVHNAHYCVMFSCIYAFKILKYKQQ